MSSLRNGKKPMSMKAQERLGMNVVNPDKMDSSFS